MLLRNLTLNFGKNCSSSLVRDITAIRRTNADAAAPVRGCALNENDEIGDDEGNHSGDKVARNGEHAAHGDCFH